MLNSESIVLVNLLLIMDYYALVREDTNRETDKDVDILIPKLNTVQQLNMSLQ